MNKILCRTAAGLVLLTASALMSVQAYTQPAVEFKIVSQPLSDALRELGTVSNTNIIFEPAMVSGIVAPAVNANITPQEALTRLLAGTRWSFKFVDENTVSLIPEDSKAAGVPPATDTSTGLQKANVPDGEGREEDERMRVGQSDSSTSSSANQTQSASSASEEAQISQVKEIIVTATKRQERLIDAPQSVSVLSSSDLSKLGATQFRDFANTVPGLSFTTAGAGFTQISIRGVTAGFDIGQTVGIYVDEVPYGSSSTFAEAARATLDVGLFDLDRIEVLRGPQGTLYGASTMGGLLKYVTERPDATRFGVDVQTGISGTQDGGVSYNAAAVVNAPLVADKVALRASGFYSHDGGYIDNVALGKDDVNRSGIYGGRADLEFTPTEALSVRIAGFAQNISRDGEATANYSFSGVPLAGGLDQIRLFEEVFDQRFRLVSGTMVYDFGSAALTSISSYQTTQGEYVGDLSPSYVPILQAFLNRSYSAVGYAQEMSTDKFTQEVRVASDGAQTLEWLIGGFYTRETSDRSQELLLRDLAGQPAPNDVFTFATPSQYEEYAAFGNLTWHLTDAFDVSGGVRFARNDQVFTQSGSGAFGVSLPTRSSREDVVTYLANARYHFSDHATGYLRYATGYRPGGPNFVLNDQNTGLPLGDPTFDADKLKSYEVGYKAETADRRFGLEVSGYLIDWSDIQVILAGSGLSTIANASGGATVQGAELSLTGRPINDLTLVGAFAYQNARLSEADTDLGAAKHARLPNVPRFTAALSGDYGLPVGGNLQPRVGATLRYVTDRVTSFDGNGFQPQYQLPEYTAFDVRAGLTFGSIDAQFYLRNVFDERGQLSAATWRGAPQVAIMQPRTIGMTVTTHF